MRRRGFQLTRYADDWVVTCQSLADAKAALAAAKRVLGELGVELHSEKTRIVHIREGFEFLGYKIKRGVRPLKLVESRIKSGAKTGGLYAYPREKSVQHFKDQIRGRLCATKAHRERKKQSRTVREMRAGPSEPPCRWRLQNWSRHAQS